MNSSQEKLIKCLGVLEKLEEQLFSISQNMPNVFGELRTNTCLLTTPSLASGRLLAPKSKILVESVHANYKQFVQLHIDSIKNSRTIFRNVQMAVLFFKGVEFIRIKASDEKQVLKLIALSKALDEVERNIQIQNARITTELFLLSNITVGTLQHFKAVKELNRSFTKYEDDGISDILMIMNLATDLRRWLKKEFVGK